MSHDAITLHQARELARFIHLAGPTFGCILGTSWLSPSPPYVDDTSTLGDFLGMPAGTVGGEAGARLLKQCGDNSLPGLGPDARCVLVLPFEHYEAAAWSLSVAIGQCIDQAEPHDDLSRALAWLSRLLTDGHSAE